MANTVAKCFFIEIYDFFAGYMPRALLQYSRRLFHFVIMARRHPADGSAETRGTAHYAGI